MEKLLQHHLIKKEGVELSVKQRKEVQYKFEGTIKPKRGQTVFEINEEALTIEPAKYKVDTVSYSYSSDKQPEKLIVNANCIYIPALNKENALKKYKNNKDQSFYYSKPPVLNLADTF